MAGLQSRSAPLTATQGGLARAMRRSAPLLAMLVRRCLANHAALQALYQDMYFIHR